MDTTLSKNEFKEKYGYSESTYQRRMSKFKSDANFSKGYIRPMAKEVRIDIIIYQSFLQSQSDNRLRIK